MKKKLFEFLAFMSLWIITASILELTPLSQWTQGAFTGVFTVSLLMIIREIDK